MGTERERKGDRLNSKVHTQPHERGLGCLSLCALAVGESRTLLDLERVIEDAAETSGHSACAEGERGGRVGLRPRILLTSRFLNETLGLRSPSTRCKQWPHTKLAKHTCTTCSMYIPATGHTED